MPKEEDDQRRKEAWERATRRDKEDREKGREEAKKREARESDQNRPTGKIKGEGENAFSDNDRKGKGAQRDTQINPLYSGKFDRGWSNGTRGLGHNRGEKNGSEKNVERWMKSSIQGMTGI